MASGHRGFSLKGSIFRGTETTSASSENNYPQSETKKQNVTQINNSGAKIEKGCTKPRPKSTSHLPAPTNLNSSIKLVGTTLKTKDNNLASTQKKPKAVESLADVKPRNIPVRSNERYKTSLRRPLSLVEGSSGIHTTANSTCRNNVEKPKTNLRRPLSLVEDSSVSARKVSIPRTIDKPSINAKIVRRNKLSEEGETTSSKTSKPNGEVVVRKNTPNNSVTKVDSHLEDKFLQNGEIVMRKKKLASKKDEDDESANGGEKRASQLNPNAVEFVMSSSASQLDQDFSKISLHDCLSESSRKLVHDLLTPNSLQEHSSSAELCSNLVTDILTSIRLGNAQSVLSSQLCFRILKESNNKCFEESLLNGLKEVIQRQCQKRKAEDRRNFEDCFATVLFLTRLLEEVVFGSFLDLQKVSSYSDIPLKVVISKLNLEIIETLLDFRPVVIRKKTHADIVSNALIAIGRNLDPNEEGSWVDFFSEKLRNAFVDAVADPEITDRSVSKTLLQLVELQASDWQLSREAQDYYYHLFSWTTDT